MIFNIYKEGIIKRGRKPIPEDERKQNRSICVKKDLYAWLLVKGEGNLSEGVKRAAIANGYQEGQQQTSVSN